MNKKLIKEAFDIMFRTTLAIAGALLVLHVMVGCTTAGGNKDRLGLNGHILVDIKGGKNYIIEKSDFGQGYWLHDILDNGRVIFNKPKK